MFRLVALVAAFAAFALPNAAVAVTLPAVHCSPSDPVVWVNTKSKVYHAKGSALYGKTKNGKYVCTSTAVGMGAHMSGQHKMAQTLPSGAKDTALVKPGHKHKQKVGTVTTLPDGTTVKSHSGTAGTTKQTLPNGQSDNSGK